MSRLTNAWKKNYVWGPVSALAISAAILADDFEHKPNNSMGTIPLNEQTESFRNRIADHEAAHAVVAMALNREHIRIEKATTAPNGTNWGSVSYNQKLATMATTRSDYLSLIAINLAGTVQEAYKYGEAADGAHQDIENATNIAIHMPIYNMDSLHPANFKNLGEHWAFSPQEQEQYQAAVKNNRVAGYNIAYNIISYHQDKIDLLAEALKNDRDSTLTGKEVEEIVGFVEGKGLPLIDDDGEEFFVENPVEAFNFDPSAEEEQEAQPETTDENQPQAGETSTEPETP